MTITALDAHLETRGIQLQAARRKGQKIVGYFPGNYVPEELIWAAGAVPLGLIRGGSAPAAEAGFSKLPQVLCPFARSLIGDALADFSPYGARLDLVVAPLTCQHLKKVAEVWEYDRQVEIFKLGVPFQHQNDFELSYFSERISDLLDRLKALTGNEVTREKLVEAIELYNRMRGLLKKISLLRRSGAAVLSARDFIRLNHGSYLADPLFMVNLLGAEYRKLLDRQDETSAGAPRIMFMGPNLLLGDEKILQLVEATGARIVIEEFCEGLRHYWRDIDLQGDLIQCLARGCLVERLPCAFMRESTGQRLDFALELIRDFKVDGVIWYELLCCETYDSEAYYFSRELGRRSIPFLMLESDYTAADAGQLRTRIEAFIEILKGGL